MTNYNNLTQNNSIKMSSSACQIMCLKQRDEFENNICNNEIIIQSNGDNSNQKEESNIVTNVCFLLIYYIIQSKFLLV